MPTPLAIARVFLFVLLLTVMIVYNEDELTYNYDEPEYDADDYETAQLISDPEFLPDYCY